MLKKHKIHSIILFIIIAMIFNGCQDENKALENNITDKTLSVKPIIKSEFMLDTICTVNLYDENDKSYFSEVFALCQKYEDLFSKTNENSDISKINNAKGKTVKVAPETIDLLNKALYYCELSKGKFDITSGVLTTAWDFGSNDKNVPSIEVIKSALETIDYNNIIIQNGEVTLLNPNSELDLGGIAKGYIADKMSAFLKQQGVRGAIINLGGNVLTVGEKSHDALWAIGVQRPFAERNENIGVVHVKEMSVVTSGIYERSFTKDNVFYHHILDLTTGFPVDNNLDSVTIISNESVDGDALSTICFLLETDDALELINSIDGIEAIFFTKAGEIIKTTGVGKDIQFEETK